MNTHIDYPLQSPTKETLTTLSLHSLVQDISNPNHSAVISLTGSLLDLTMTSIENILLQTQLNQTIIALNPTSTFQSLSLLPYTGQLGTWLTLTVYNLLMNLPVFQVYVC